MFRTTVVVAQTAVLRPHQMHDDVVRCLGQRSTKVTGLRIIAEQRMHHRGHEAHVLKLSAVAGRELYAVLRRLDRGGDGADAGLLFRRYPYANSLSLRHRRQAQVAPVRGLGEAPFSEAARFN